MTDKKGSEWADTEAIADTDLIGGVKHMTTAPVTAYRAFSLIKSTLKTYLNPYLVPSGGMIPYGGASAPTGWLMCDGASLLRADYATLFTAIGTAFGAADGTHFNVPDMRGVYPKGAGTTNRAAGKDANGNYYAATLAAYVTDKMQGHKHALDYGESATLFGSGYLSSGNDVSPTSSTTTVQSPIADGTNGTPRTGLTTEPQNLGLNYIIKT